MMPFLDKVDIRQGTRSTPRFSNGNTLPLTQMPFGMASFVPQTNAKNGNWFYSPEDRCLEGVRLTHQPSPWIGDYGAIVFQPQAGQPCVSLDRRWSGYRPEEAVLRPDYLSLKFLRSQCQLEVTPTERGGVIRTTFTEEKPEWISFFSVGGHTTWEWDMQKNQLYISTTDHNTLDNPVDFCMYVVVRFSSKAINQGGILYSCQDENLASYAGSMQAADSFHLPVNEKKIEYQIAISYISLSQAICNLNQDAGSFEQKKAAATKVWEEHLSRIEIRAKTKKQEKTFYSCLYRVFLFPHKAYELDETGKAIHYAPCDGKAHEGVRYTDNGFWDTFRTIYPLYAIIARKEYAEIIEGFVNDYVESGWLPRWPSIGETNCMPSTLIDAVIADAAVKEVITGDVLDIAFDGMLKNANEQSTDPRNGRSGVLSYLKYGYVPCNEQRESVNLTLDAAYCDFCIAQVAEKLEKDDVAQQYYLRSKNYQNLFDKQTGYMRPKSNSGDFKNSFNPFTWGLDYTEASAVQTSLFVPHDMDGLANLMGGKDKLAQKVDQIFATPPVYAVDGYGFEIHEMTEMAAVNFGQCAISNQPSFHIPYIYSVLGDKNKTLYWVDKICSELFSYETDGFPGDEDNGTMSAWYVFSCLGLYPFCPGKDEYLVNKMLVKSARILQKKWSPSKRAQKLTVREILNELI